MQPSLVVRLLEHEEKYPDRVYLKQPKSGAWVLWTWADTMRQARQVAAFLTSLGLKRGAHIALYSKNCAEWFIIDFGITLAGMVNVPLFSNQHEHSIGYVLAHAEVALVFIGKLDQPHQARNSIPEHYPTVGLDYHQELATTYRWEHIEITQPKVDIVMPEASDLYTIIYSSGTTGEPKGAMFTHETMANYLAVFANDIHRVAKSEFYHLLSYLPLAHVYERAVIQLGSLTLPCDVSFVESLDQFADNLRAVQPTLFAAVPRIWDVFQHKIEQRIPPKLLHILLAIPGLSSLIRLKIRKDMGLNRSLGNFSGASHLPVSILTFFDQLHIPIQEGYGQTENFAYGTLSLLHERRGGYVGTPRLGVEIKLSPEGELLMTGPALMTGYFKNAEATAAALENGWLHTGDFAEIDANSRVKILGRLSENFKNLKGEFVAPTPIEKRFRTNRVIEALCLVGRELASNVLLVVLSAEGRRKPREKISAWFEKQLHNTNRKLKSYEKISHILVVSDHWTIENDMLTPTQKVKRRVVEAHYQARIQQAIIQARSVVWESEL